MFNKAAWRFLCSTLALCVPLLYSLGHLSAQGYWLDAGEFVAQATELGISHPPGHPLYALTTYPLTWIPLGSLEWRVAFASALWAAVASLVFYKILVEIAEAHALTRSPLVYGSILALTLALTLAPAWQLQAVRPEVYALQAALNVLSLYLTLLALTAKAPETQMRYALSALCTVGFGLANHHLLAFGTLAAVLVGMGSCTLLSKRRLLQFGALSLGLPLATYLYLPLRTLAAGDQLRLGQPTNWSRLIWLVSAKAFQKNQGQDVPQPLLERLFDTVVAVSTEIGVSTMVAAVLGAYLAIRLRPLRVLGVFFLSLSLGFMGIRAWLGFVRSNPDALGYLLTAFVGVTVLLALGIAAFSIARSAEKVFAVALVLLALASFISRRPQVNANLSDFEATDYFDDMRRRSLPTRAVVILYTPENIFRFWGAEAVEKLRPDIHLVPVPFLVYPGFAAALLQEVPELYPLLAHYESHHRFAREDLVALTHQRPVIVEPDLRWPDEQLSSIVPAGHFYRFHPDPLPQGLVKERARAQFLNYQHLARHIDPLRDPATRAVWLWSRYLDARYYRRMQEWRAALEALEDARFLAPMDRDLEALRRAIVPYN